MVSLNLTCLPAMKDPIPSVPGYVFGTSHFTYQDRLWEVIYHKITEELPQVDLSAWMPVIEMFGSGELANLLIYEDRVHILYTSNMNLLPHKPVPLSIRTHITYSAREKNLYGVHLDPESSANPFKRFAIDGYRGFTQSKLGLESLPDFVSEGLWLGPIRDTLYFVLPLVPMTYQHEMVAGLFHHLYAETVIVENNTNFPLAMLEEWNSNYPVEDDDDASEFS